MNENNDLDINKIQGYDEETRKISSERIEEVINIFTASSETRYVNYYEILGISPKAPQEIVKRAYRALAPVFHPDSTKFEEEKKKIGVEVFKKIAEAYATLSDPEKRKEYDSGPQDLLIKGGEDIGDLNAFFKRFTKNFKQNIPLELVRYLIRNDQNLRTSLRENGFEIPNPEDISPNWCEDHELLKETYTYWKNLDNTAKQILLQQFAKSAVRKKHEQKRQEGIEYFIVEDFDENFINYLIQNHIQNSTGTAKFLFSNLGPNDVKLCVQYLWEIELNSKDRERIFQAYDNNKSYKRFLKNLKDRIRKEDDLKTFQGNMVSMKTLQGTVETQVVNDDGTITVSGFTCLPISNETDFVKLNYAKKEDKSQELDFISLGQTIDQEAIFFVPYNSTMENYTAKAYHQSLLDNGSSQNYQDINWLISQTLEFVANQMPFTSPYEVESFTQKSKSNFISLSSFVMGSYSRVTLPLNAGIGNSRHRSLYFLFLLGKLLGHEATKNQEVVLYNNKQQPQPPSDENSELSLFSIHKENGVSVHQHRAIYNGEDYMWAIVNCPQNLFLIDTLTQAVFDLSQPRDLRKAQKVYGKQIINQMLRLHRPNHPSLLNENESKIIITDHEVIEVTEVIEEFPEVKMTTSMEPNLEDHLERVKDNEHQEVTKEEVISSLTEEHSQTEEASSEHDLPKEKEESDQEQYEKLLKAAAKRNMPVVLLAFNTGEENLVKIAIENSSEEELLQARDKQGNNILHLALRKDFIEIANLIDEKNLTGSLLNESNSIGKTPFEAVKQKLRSLSNDHPERPDELNSLISNLLEEVKHHQKRFLNKNSKITYGAMLAAYSSAKQLEGYEEAYTNALQKITENLETNTPTLKIIAYILASILALALLATAVTVLVLMITNPLGWAAVLGAVIGTTAAMETAATVGIATAATAGTLGAAGTVGISFFVKPRLDEKRSLEKMKERLTEINEQVSPSKSMSTS